MTRNLNYALAALVVVALSAMQSGCGDGETNSPAVRLTTLRRWRRQPTLLTSIPSASRLSMSPHHRSLADINIEVTLSAVTPT